MKRYTPCILLILLITGCKKQNNQPTLAFSDLPFKQGDTWVYSRYDAVVNVRDTVSITIPYVASKNGNTTYLWVQTADGVNDTASWLLHNDTLFGNANITKVPIPWVYEIVFPLSNGSSWYNDLGSCSIISQLQINNISYSNVYMVSWQEMTFQGFIMTESLYVVKGIGVVCYNQDTSPAADSISYMGSTSYQWNLLSYHLN